MIDHYAYDCDPRPPLRWRRIAILLAAVAAVLALTGLAHAQADINRPPVCGTAEQVNTELAKYGEHPVAMGPTTSGNLVALYVDDADGSWTLVERMPTSPPVTCLLRAGEGWQSAKQAEGVPS